VKGISLPLLLRILHWSTRAAARRLLHERKHEGPLGCLRFRHSMRRRIIQALAIIVRAWTAELLIFNTADLHLVTEIQGTDGWWAWRFKLSVRSRTLFYVVVGS
jgi:hypothetical protein